MQGFSSRSNCGRGQMDNPSRDGRDASPQASVVRSGVAAATEVGHLGDVPLVRPQAHNNSWVKVPTGGS